MTPEKNKWFNHQYLMKQKDADLAKDFTPILTEKGIDTFGMTKLEKIVSLIKERANFVSEFWDLSDFFLLLQRLMMKKQEKIGKKKLPL